MAKPFLSFNAQINKLKNEKQLIITNYVYAERMLREIGYFGLIGGYKSPFKNPTTKKYKDGVAFEDIVALYKFDENLRELFLKYITRISKNSSKVFQKFLHTSLKKLSHYPKPQFIG